MTPQPFDPGIIQGLSGGCRIIAPDGDHEKFVKAGATMVHSSTMARKSLRFVGIDLSNGTIQEITPLGSVPATTSTPQPQAAPIPEQTFSIPSEPVRPAMAGIVAAQKIVDSLPPAPPPRLMKEVLLELPDTDVPFQCYDIIFNERFRFLTLVTPLKPPAIPKPGRPIEIMIDGKRHYCQNYGTFVSIPSFGISVLQLTYSLEKPEEKGKKESSQPDSAAV